MKIVVALSGGVDSVVLLDELVRSGEHEIIVAHFDHGIREDSLAGARFSEGLAQYYGLPFEVRHGGLGVSASENTARLARYAFLFEVAEKYQARLATAHHLDDLVETIALNIQRGTRWRGLACMSDERIWRPLLKRTKSELMEYAVSRGLEWCEDETNQHETYRRNILRKKLAGLPYGSKLRLHELWRLQHDLSRQIAREIEQGDFPISLRYFMIMIDSATARELLYSYILRVFSVSLLASQLDYLLLAIRTGKSGTYWQAGNRVTAFLLDREWRAEMIE